MRADVTVRSGTGRRLDGVGESRQRRQMSRPLPGHAAGQWTKYQVAAYLVRTYAQLPVFQTQPPTMRTNDVVTMTRINLHTQSA